MNEAFAFRAWFAINPAPANMLAVLYRARGEIVPHETLLRELRTTVLGVRSAAFLLHGAMEPGSLVVRRCQGYRLSPIGMADCRAALADAQQRAAA